MGGLLGRLQKNGGVSLEVAVKDEPAVELADAAEDSRHGTRTDTKVGERGGKVLQLLQAHVEHVGPLRKEIAEQLPQVAHISIDGIGGESFFQPQVALVASAHATFHHRSGLLYKKQRQRKNDA